jgi:hypothetical protein
MEELLKAYYACLELAKENAFKCVIQIETNQGSGDPFFEVWVKKFKENFDISQRIPFYTFLPDELQSNVEKVKQLIQEASC